MSCYGAIEVNNAEHGFQLQTKHGFGKIAFYVEGVERFDLPNYPVAREMADNVFGLLGNPGEPRKIFAYLKNGVK